MYHVIVRRRVRGIFEALGRGDYEVAMAGFAPRFEHIFAGRHALGGERHTTAAMRLWFQRLFRLLPHLGCSDDLTKRDSHEGANQIQR
jgi:ketosteroid isomerase-like protein